MKRLLFLLVLFALPVSTWGQGARFDGVAQRTIQNFLAPIPGAQIVVCTSAGTGTPCSPTTPIYTDQGLTQLIPGSTITADSNGNFGFWTAASQTVKYSITATGITGQLFTVVLPAVSGGAGSFTSITATGAVTLTGAATTKQQNNIIQVDGVTYTGAQALQSAIQACSGLAACIVDARNPLIGTQTFTTNPFSGLNIPVSLSTGAYTVQWDHSAFFVDYPSHFRWEMNGTTVLNSSGSIGTGISQIPGILAFNSFLGNRLYNTTGSITSGQKTLTVASATGIVPGVLVNVFGAAGGQALQQTTTNGATGTGASFVVTALTGWDNTGSKTNYLQVENEQISCTMSGQTANTFTGCTRGINGTTAVSHNTGVNVQALLPFITPVLSVSGLTVTLQDAATVTVTSAPVYAGVTDVIFDGTGTFDFNQTVATTSRFENFLITLSTNVTVSQGMTMKRFDQGGITLVGSRDNHILARHYEGNGKPPNAQGWDIGIFESSSYNHVVSASHSVGVDAAGASAGDIGLFIDDRSTNSTMFDGACIGNTAALGSIGTPSFGYTDGVIIQSTSKNNFVTVPFVKIGGAGGTNALEINYDGDWTSNVTPTGNVIQFGAVDGTGATAITTTGFTGVGNNNFIGGQVIGGSISILSGSDYATFMSGSAWTNVGRLYDAQYIRSGGALGFPDIFGDGTHSVVIGDANGTKIVPAASGFIQNSAGTAAQAFTLKTGSGVANYTGTNTAAYAAVDTTNLCTTLTIPTGWKLSVSASGVLGSNTAAVAQNVALADAGTTCAGGGVTALNGTERNITPPAAGTFDEPFQTQYVFTGDGAAHSIALMAKTSNAADAWSIQNTSVTVAPSMIYTLMPSN